MADFIKRLSDSASLTDILIQVEDWLDSLDIYVFKNWFEGEIADGPTIERHWVSIILKYPYDEMPDPEGGIRLLKYGAKVMFKKTQEEDTEDQKQEDIKDLERHAENSQDIEFHSHSRTAPQLKEVWLVEIKIPRHFIDELEQMDDLTDDNIEPEHIRAVHDADLQAKDAYTDDDEAEHTQDETTGEIDQQESGEEV